MKYWDEILKENLTYEEAKAEMAARYVTRSEWDGIHFIDTEGKYCILTKDGEIIIDPEEVFDKDKNDWIVVGITEDAVNILQQLVK